MKTNTQLSTLADLGWKLIPIGAKSKFPRMVDWPSLASSDQDQIEAWSENAPNQNWGVLLGEPSGIVDFECDDDAAEDRLIELFEGDVPVTLMYSANRGNHRLFKYRDDLPDVAVARLDNLEIRIGGGGKAAQSVIPPSVHPSGKPYVWIVSPEDCNVAELPDYVAEKIRGLVGGARSKTVGDWRRVADGVDEGFRAQSATQFIGKVFEQCADVFHNDSVNYCFSVVKIWNNQNDPPLAEDELTRTFDSILKRERSSRMNDQLSEGLPRQVPLDHEVAETPSGWRCIVMMGNPRVYHLFSPLWSGYVELSTSQYLNPRLIREQVLEQKLVVLPDSFRRMWQGDQRTDGISRQLIDVADKVEVDLEDDRLLVIASVLRDQISGAYDLRDGKEPDGTPQKLSDGSVVFKFGKMLERISFSGGEKISRRDLSKVLKIVEATNYRQRTFKRLTPSSLAALDELVE